MLVALDSELDGTLADGLGDLGDLGNVSVEQLQHSLRNLAQASGWPSANPGNVTGSVNPQTVMAVTAVLSKLSGKISGSVQKALQIALPLATMNSTLMGAAKTAIRQYAQYLSAGVRGLTALYARSSAPPMPPAPTFQPPTGMLMPGLGPYSSPSAKLPATAIQARTKDGLFRVAIPSMIASGLGGPSMDLGASYQELPVRMKMAPGVPLVSVGDFEDKTGTTPLYKKPWFIAAIGGGVVVLGGGTYLIMRK